MSIVSRCVAQAIDAAVHGDADFRLSLEAKNDASRWLQISWDTINAAYPRSEEPVHVLNEFAIAIPSHVAVSEWVPKQYVTFEHGAEPQRVLVSFIEAYCAHVLGHEATAEKFKVMEETANHGAN